MIRVVKVNQLRKPEDRATVAYCGRPFAGWKGHALANPFRPKIAGQLGECLAKYRAWLLARPTLEADLATLWEETGHGAKALGCWCCDWDGIQPITPICHAVVLSQMLQERFVI